MKVPHLADTPEERKATYESMCEVMAALHKVDYKEVGLEDFGRPSGYIQRQLKTWGNMYVYILFALYIHAGD